MVDLALAKDKNLICYTHSSFYAVQMIDSSEVELSGVFVHQVGNKLRQEGTVFSESPLKLSKTLSGALLNYFFNHFRNSESAFKLTHPAGKAQNAIFAISSRIFKGAALAEESQKAAAHLYDVSDHPRIKQGALYVAHFRNIKFDGKSADAIGYFKTDHSDQFLSVDFSGKQSSVSINEGMRVKSFDKGALVVGLNASDGLRVVQAVSQADEASYWRDDFLKAVPVTKDAEYTKQFIGLCRRYGSVIETESGASEKARFLDATYSYFTENEAFDAKEFRRHLPEEMRPGFEKYRVDSGSQAESPLPERFEVSASVVKKHKKVFTASIRLDDCVEIKVNPSRGEFDPTRVEKGFDRKRGLSYYKFYFEEES